MKKNKDNIPLREALPLFFSSVKKLWRIERKFTILSCIYYLLGTIPVILTAFATALFNQKIMSSETEYESYFIAFYPLIVAFIVNILYGIFGSTIKYLETKYIEKITQHILRDSCDKSEKIDYSSYDDPCFYDIIQKGWSEDGTSLIASTNTVLETIREVAGIISYISILAYIDIKLMLFLTLLRIAINPVVNKINGMNYRLNNKLAESRRKEQYYRNFFDNKYSSTEGKIYELHNYAYYNFLDSHRHVFAETVKNKIQVNAINLLSYAIYTLPLSLSYIYLSVGVYKGNVSIANMAMYVSLYAGFINQIYGVINQLSGIRIYAEKSRYAREYLSIPTHIYTDEDCNKPKVVQTDNGHSVEFRNVSFRYPNTSKFVIENVSFKILPKECVSIIGENGAGKTTLIYLLMRIYEPQVGEILLDDKDIRDYSVKSLYSIFGTLFQDYCNYAVSAKESIALSSKNVNIERMEAALRCSTVYKFISNLPYGLETTLSRQFDSNGVELSVGQNQRIALARSFYKDTSIIVLDEPSASIDPESETEILKTIQNLKGKKSVWIVSHRLSTCNISDRVLILKDGRLIGDGSHTQLLKTNPEYKRIYTLHAEKYIK